MVTNFFNLLSNMPEAPAAQKPPPASVIRAAQSDAPVSKSQAKRNRKKLRDAGGA